MQDAERQAPPPVTSPGSLYDQSGRLADLARDSRATQLNDLVTIVILDKASAVSKGTTSTSRKSNASASISAMGGPVKTPGPLSSLAGLSGSNKLEGQGATSRETELRTTVSARVTHVLPNGNMVVEGTKDVMINSEHQKVSIRGILRGKDLSTDNNVSSDRLADLEVRVDGRGVVNDAIRRPNFLYRLMLGILPF
ncbi:flagellar basal body L-ring protein FlgH [Paludibaculum fermentans]|uniref:Flagellar basal body L-ring protein FlgH n=1 Tax=Paludibaculum fermentans TaxID=1473598 RepID=A0A7S7NPU7_PALFE|nr:flagellar basal body L-ring protein FlgH [Paludibaculum fermentans]QOY87581.1 flagellar basal body L-ring protein FlgH [Paludibaculum fermentans]